MRIKNVSGEDDDNESVSIDFKSFMRDNKQSFMVVSRTPFEIQDDNVPSPVISSIIPHSPISNLDKTIPEKQTTDPAMDTFQKQMVQFFEGDEGWEDLDGLSNRNTNDDGISN